MNRFTYDIRVYWEDTDAGGIVFYANYLKFMERARTEWLRDMGVQQQLLRDDTGGMFVVTETQVRYHRPARLDDLLCVSAELKHMGQASITLSQQVVLAADPAYKLAEGTIRIGWVEAATLRPVRMPSALLGTLERHRAPSTEEPHRRT
ncbi:tol-pal system-associated acyl-CoA thioesterase [uncultured Pseudacidovorax sp.]|uniref:tol-pal system-associated acyl-CoA thioesterase n=1 Tax=uncultured Pseudacidovorax sp. TaxID=679313 RepID=UPI0025FA9224|nr:tol-pal system-associated acyl-CoA thioesterase [uncultured Pseudacidovorax sp.]